MRRLCPQCHGTYETQFLCPNCGVEMREVQDSIVTAPRPVEITRAGVPGMGMRFFAGFLLAQGAYYGVSQFGIALDTALGDSASWSTLGSVGNTALMLLAVVAGSLRAGAGNPRGMAGGAALGLFHALALIGAGLVFGHWSVRPMLFAGWVPLTAAAGAIGGKCGRYIWPAVIDIQRPAREAVKSSRASRPKSATPSRPRVAIAWPRVIAGAALSISCTIWAGQIRDFIIGTSGGKFSVD